MNVLQPTGLKKRKFPPSLQLGLKHTVLICGLKMKKPDEKMKETQRLFKQAITEVFFCFKIFSSIAAAVDFASYLKKSYCYIAAYVGVNWGFNELWINYITVFYL